MSSILDMVLASTESRLNGAPVIVGENHDLNSINWVAGLSDPGEMIGCGMYQQLRRKDAESDRAYYQRLQVELALVPAAVRQKIEVAMIAAALKRAGLDASNGRVNVMVAGDPAWHGLGVNVAAAVTAAQAIDLAGQNWTVEKVAAQYDFNGTVKTAKGVFLLIRQDTGEALGNVGSRYQVIQNAQGYDFLDRVMGEYGAKFHTAGSVHGGKKIWMQCELPKQGFEVVRGDAIESYCTFFNPHDGSGKAFVFATTNRIVCNNTLRMGLADKGKGIGIRHTGDIDASIVDAQEALGLAVARFEKFKDEAQTLVRTPVRDAQGYFNGVLDAILDVTEAQAKVGAGNLAQSDLLNGIVATTEARQKAEAAYARAIEKRTNILDDIIERYESEKNGVGGIRGSAWSALNAVTEHADHYREGRKIGTEHDRNSRFFEDTIAGTRDDLKQTALAAALALAN